MSRVPRARGAARTAGPARESDPQVLIRLDPEAYAILSRIALSRGVAPTTMARMLMRKALREARAEAVRSPLP
jgi:hypothetical protein